MSLNRVIKKLISIYTIFLSAILFVGCNQGTSSTSKDSSFNNDANVTTGDVLVAYFSRAGENWQVGNVEEGNTKVFANYIIDYTGFDSYEIEPVIPYPVSYNEMLEVAREEQNSNARPEIKKYIDSLDAYDTILLGYPIWNSKLPNIMLTFLEHYDFTGKTIITFCTHGGSSFGSTINQINSIIDNATIVQGLAISGSSISRGY